MTQRIMQQKKRIFSLILAITMVVGIISPGSAITVKAGDFDGYVYVTVERFTLGQGLAAEPKKIGYNDGDSVEDILKRGYGEEKLVLSQGQWGASFDGFVDGGEPEGWTINDIPEKMIVALEKGAEGQYAPPAVSKTAITNRTTADTLADFPDKDELIREIVNYTGDKNKDCYKDAVSVLEDWDATATEVKNAEDLLKKSKKNIAVYILKH